MESHDYSSHFYVQCRLFERNSRVRTEKQKFIRLEIYQNDKEILYIHRRYQVAISQEIFSQVLLSTNFKSKKRPQEKLMPVTKWIASSYP